MIACLNCIVSSSKRRQYRKYIPQDAISCHILVAFQCTFYEVISIYFLESRVGQYFDIFIYRDICSRDYRIKGKNLSDDLSKLSSCSMTILVLLGNLYVAWKILKKIESIFAFQQQMYSHNVYLAKHRLL